MREVGRATRFTFAVVAVSVILTIGARAEIPAPAGAKAADAVVLKSFSASESKDTSASSLAAPRSESPALPHAEVGQSSRAGVFEVELAKAARSHGLPINFFKRLIWQESRFKPYAISRAGAMGIAQFTPGTAEWRGVSDPFNPTEALDESARWLRELWGQFGNLGLAAAAYNAGPVRVTRWLSGQSSLPAETRAYVKIVTGALADRWSACAASGSRQSCPDGSREPPPTAVSAGRSRGMPRPVQAVLAPGGVTITDIDAGPWGPWGLQLTGDWSQARAIAQFKKIQIRFAGVLGDRKPVVLRGHMAGKGSATWYRVRVAEATRERAVTLCARLEKAGGSCLVLRN